MLLFNPSLTMNDVMTLSELAIGCSARILEVGGEGSMRSHLLSLGLLPETLVTLEKTAPLGDPLQLRLYGYELTLRRSEARHIRVQKLDEDEGENLLSPASHVPSSAPTGRGLEHPGLGENGRFHDASTATPLPPTETLTFALVGNQNCGKTMLFNDLTGMKGHVGNFPGVTVDYKSGAIKGYPQTSLTDLPGIYSLSPYTSEEIVTRNFILQSKPKCIINIVDASNIERNLYLTLQLMELSIPMVLALNMMDEVRKNGGALHMNLLERRLGIPVVPISALKGEGVHELVEHALHIARYQEKPQHLDFCQAQGRGAAVHRSLHAVMHLIEDHAAAADLPLRWAASRVVEGDKQIRGHLRLSPTEEEAVSLLIHQMEQERGMDAVAAMADMRYAFIHSLCAEAVVRPRESREHRRSRHIDRWLTGRFTALPVFALLMALMFYLTFDLIGGTLQEWLAQGLAVFTQWAGAALAQAGVGDGVRRLLLDGVVGGIGAVATFVPIIATLFTLLSLFEDSGYMARIAFVMDKLLRRIGLSGRSIVPLLLGFGCSVPAVMASRTLPSLRDRRLTVLLTPFMSCTAKLPVYVFFTAVFFPGQALWVMLSLYVLGIVIAVVTASLLKRTAFRGEAVPFVMELPPYRMPGIKSVLLLAWDKSKDFLQRAFTVIFVASIVVWILQSFSFQGAMVSSEHSILSALGRWISPLFAPLGFGDWRMAVALISGFFAKESVVSSLILLFGSGAALGVALCGASAFSFLVFCLLYTPCIATIATIKHELGGRMAWLIAGWQCLVAWAAAFGAYHLWIWLVG